jgi:hypothetical protein
MNVQVRSFGEAGKKPLHRQWPILLSGLVSPCRTGFRSGCGRSQPFGASGRRLCGSDLSGGGEGKTGENADLEVHDCIPVYSSPAMHGEDLLSRLRGLLKPVLRTE